jgi:ubiquinone/menaquinone biosynthesis C-methylase UbiE
MSSSVAGLTKPRTLVGLGGLVTLGAAYWWRTHPSACPYSQRFWVEAPHPFITRKRLLEILAPQAGERVLEVGPGTGYYSLDVASRLDGGSLAVFDIQREMLDHVMRRAAERGISNIEPTLGDARSLPYDGNSFDAAYLVTVLGEIPDPGAAVGELGRVLRPGGRLVVGELFGDPHMVTLGRLRDLAQPAGFSYDRRLGTLLGYFACFRAPAA